MLKRVSLLMFLMVVTASLLFAGTVYYVDATNGNDSNNGRSLGTAWKTLARVNQSSFLPGDSILFKRGEEWREASGLVIEGYDGTSGSRITFGAYGNKVIIFFWSEVPVAIRIKNKEIKDSFKKHFELLWKQI